MVKGPCCFDSVREPATIWLPQVVWKNPKVMKTKFTNVAIHENYVYGLSDGILECVDLTDGLSKWKQGRYGHGQILLVNDLLLVLSEKGEVVLVEATPERPNNVLGRFQAHRWADMEQLRPVRPVPARPKCR